jgi:hypothetical protein
MEAGIANCKASKNTKTDFFIRTSSLQVVEDKKYPF